MLITGLIVAGTALAAYSTYQQFETAKEQAKIQKENIQLQQEKMKLQEEARQIQEDMAEASARRNMRRQQAQIAIKEAMSGTTSSTAYSNLLASADTTLESGLAKQSELSGIKSDVYGLSQDQLQLKYDNISAPSNLDLAIGLGSTVVSGATQYYGYQQSKPTVNIDSFQAGNQTYKPTSSGYSVPQSNSSNMAGFDSFTINN